MAALRREGGSSRCRGALLPVPRGSPLVVALLLLALLALLGLGMMPMARAAASGLRRDRPPPTTSSDAAVEEEPAAGAVVDLELDAWGEVVGMHEHDKASAASPGLSFPLPGEEGNWEMYKGWRDIAAAENFTAADYLSVRGAVLSLTPDNDGEQSIFPMCELFKIGAALRLHCIIIALSMRGACVGGARGGY